MKKKCPPDVYLKFATHIEDNDIVVNDIKKKTGISNTHLHFILKGERPLTEGKRKKLNAALKTKY